LDMWGRHKLTMSKRSKKRSVIAYTSDHPGFCPPG